MPFAIWENLILTILSKSVRGILQNGAVLAYLGNSPILGPERGKINAGHNKNFISGIWLCLFVTGIAC